MVNRSPARRRASCSGAQPATRVASSTSGTVFETYAVVVGDWYCNCTISPTGKRPFEQREVPMRVELRCPGCGCHFPAAPESPMGEALARLAEQGPWSALGDGETLEDMIVAALP